MSEYPSDGHKEKPGLCVTVNDASETIIINNDPAPPATPAIPPKAPKGGTANVDTP
jgi:hypothetical protein